MPWTSRNEIPEALRGLELEDANLWREHFDRLHRSGLAPVDAASKAWVELRKGKVGQPIVFVLRKGGPRKKPTATQTVHVDQHLAHNPGGHGLHIVHSHDSTRPKAADEPAKPRASKAEPEVTSGGDVSTVWIQGSRLADFQEAVGKLAKKATRLGLTPPTIRSTGQVKTEELKTWTMSGRPIVGGTIQLHEFEVTSPAFKLKGWQLYAKAEPRGPKDSIVHVFGKEGAAIPKKYGQGSTHCDHCDVERKRKNLFILKKPGKTGPTAWKQVGGECVKDFTGQDAGLLENAMGLTGALNELLKENTERGEGGWGSAPRRHAPELVLTLAFAAIAATGGYIRGDMGTSTKNEVAEALHKIHKGQMKVDTGPDDVHLKKAEAALKWLRALPRLAPGEFMEKLRVTYADPDGVNPRDLGLAVYAAEAYRKSLGEAAQEEAKKKAPPAVPYIGKPGDKFGGKQSAADKKAGVERLAPIEITVTDVSTRPNEFRGHTTRIDFVDDEGRAGVWWAGRSVFTAPLPEGADENSSEWHFHVPGHEEGTTTHAGNYNEEVQPGRRYLIAGGTVKSHDEFRGNKRTTVTRVTLHPVPSDSELRKHYDSGLTYGSKDDGDDGHRKRVEHLVRLHNEAMSRAAGKAPPPPAKKLKKGSRLVLRLGRAA